MKPCRHPAGRLRAGLSLVRARHEISVSVSALRRRLLADPGSSEPPRNITVSEPPKAAREPALPAESICHPFFGALKRKPPARVRGERKPACLGLCQ